MTNFGGLNYPDFDALLIDNLSDQETDFSTYLYHADPYPISVDIHQGAGTDSMSTAAHTWHQLQSQLLQLAENHQRWGSQLLEEWQGAAATLMHSRAVLCALALRHAAQIAEKTGNDIKRASEAFRTARTTVPPPAEFQRQPGVLPMQDIPYWEARLRLVRAMEIYHYAIREITANKPPQPISCVKNARSWQGASGSNAHPTAMT